MNERLTELRGRINDLAHQQQVYRAKTAAALGGGVFLLLLTLGAAYDSFFSGSIIWISWGIARSEMYVLTGGLAVASLLLLGLAFMRDRVRDRDAEARLAQLEQEYSDLTEQGESLS